MSRSIGSACFALLTLASFELAIGADAAAGAERTRYRVRLTLEGVGGPANFDDCPARPGKEVLEGTVGGIEAELASNQQVEYSGVVERKTNSAFCDLKGEGDTTHYCVTNRNGRSKVKLRIKIYSDRDGAFIQWTPVAGSGSAQAAGDCDPEISDYLQTSYMKEGDSVDMPTVPQGALIEGRKTVETEGGAITTLEVLKPKKLKAVPGGPYAVERGTQIVLDGSRSEGEITDYVWKIAMKDCKLADDTPVNAEVELHGAQVPIRPLCDIEATLKVTDGTDSDGPVAAQVDFSARPWKTRVTVISGNLLNAKLFHPCGCELGRNICAVEFRDGKMTSGHYFHKPESSPTYESSQYDLARNTDPSGLFDQWWWVSQKVMKLERAELVNVLLTEDSVLLKENSGNTKADFGLLVASVRRHEQIHSELITKGVSQPDPAEKIETLLQLPAAQPEPLRPCADSVIEQSEGFIESSDTEAAVIAQMIAEGTYDVPATVRLRNSQQSGYGDQHFSELARESDRTTTTANTGPAPTGFASCSALNRPSLPSSGTNNPPPAAPPPPPR